MFASLGGLALAAAALWLPGSIGHLAAHLALGVVPGLGLSLLLLPRAGRLTQITIGSALGPLVATCLAWAMLMAGRSWAEAATVVVAGGLAMLLCGLTVARAPAADPEQGPGLDRFGVLALLLAVTFVALPPLLNSFNRIRSDSWIHAGIAIDLLEHGVPPIDPRFAGLRLNYVWFYNLYLALVSATGGGRGLFGSMVLMNVTDMGVLMAITWLLAMRCWRSIEAARGSLLLLSFGLGAGAWLLWPLHGLRTLRGEQQGSAEWARILSEVHLDSTFVFHTLTAPFAAMVNHWDKWTVGSSIGYAYLFVGVMLLALARTASAGAWRWRVIAALAAAAMLLFHSVVGLSVVPVTLGALVLRWLIASPPRDAAATRRLVLDGLAIGMGAVATLPYLRSITAGWSAGRSGVAHQFLHLHWLMPWTLLTACGIAAAFAWPGLQRAWRGTDAAQRLVAAWLTGMVSFALIVHLPEGNEVKFVWPVFFALAVLGGQSAWSWVTRPRARMRRAGFTLGAMLVFAVPPALSLWGLLHDSAEAYQPELRDVMRPAPGSTAFQRWVRSATPQDALFLDAEGRDHLMVLGRRRLLVGTRFEPQRAAFPVEEMALRRRLQFELFGDLADPERTVHELRGVLRRIRAVHPVEAAYVVYRDVDREPQPTRWQRLVASTPGLAVVHHADGIVVVRVPVE